MNKHRSKEPPTRPGRDFRVRLNGPAVTRGERRLSVTAAYLGWAATVALVWLFRDLDLPVWTLVFAALTGMIALLGLTKIVFNAARSWRIANQTDNRLDEREQRVRDRAHLESYRLLATLVVLGLAYAGFAYESGFWLPTTWAGIQTVFWSALLLVLTLPAAIVTWTEPETSFNEVIEPSPLVQRLIEEGRTVDAIRAYREDHPEAGLSEALTIVKSAHQAERESNPS